MLFRKCGCGCGKWVSITRGGKRENKYYNTHHRQNHFNQKRNGTAKTANPKTLFTWEEMSPYDRYKTMNLSQMDAVCKETRKTYGQYQTMYYTHTLPDDFAIHIFEKENQT